jgi:hypothetical protein
MNTPSINYSIDSLSLLNDDNNNDDENNFTKKINKNKGTFNVLDLDEEHLKNYYENIIMNGKFLNENKTNDCQSKSEIENFANDFWDFRDKTEKNTSNYVDPVSRINEIIYENNNEKIDNFGTKISDVYDKITNDKNIHTNTTCAKGLHNCFSTDEINIFENKGSMLKKDKSGNYYTVHNWHFDEDNNNVNNGGIFFDSIEGYDHMSTNNLAMD